MGYGMFFYNFLLIFFVFSSFCFGMNQDFFLKPIQESKETPDKYLKGSKSSVKLDPQELKSILEDHAENYGFGYKTANLELLDCLIAKSGMPNIVVPNFYAISSNGIQRAFRVFGSLDIQKAWNNVIKRGVATFSAQMQLQSGQFSLDFLNALEGFRTDLESEFGSLYKKADDALKRNAQAPVLDACFGEKIYTNRRDLLDAPANILQHFLNNCRQRDIKLMVRSTGKEDTLELANAGGNLSVVNVEPDELKVFLAIKDVVLSYFSEKSLLQRLKNGDKGLFELDNLIIPVLLQEMVDERAASLSPSKYSVLGRSSGVFSSPGGEGFDPSKSFSYDSDAIQEELQVNAASADDTLSKAVSKERSLSRLEEFKLQQLSVDVGSFEDVPQSKGSPVTPKKLLANNSMVVSGVLFSRDPECGKAMQGATVIQAAYGHGEGIVNSIVLFDTYYSFINSENSVDMYSIIREKRERLAVDRTSKKLEKTINNKEVAIINALSPEQVEVLTRLGKYLESCYGYSLDIEFVVKQGVIYIVQARPIVFREHEEDPSYLNNNLEFAGEKRQGTSIGVAGGFVRKIDSKDAVLWAANIGLALEEYLRPGFNTGAIQAVIVGAMAPSTSHEATTFRAEGKPVLFLKDWDVLKEQFDANKFLGIDTQQGVAYLLDQSKKEDFARAIVTGWVCYPMPRELTVSVNDPFLSYGSLELLEFIDSINQPVKFSGKLLDGLKKVPSNEIALLLSLYKKAIEKTLVLSHLQEQDKNLLRSKEAIEKAIAYLSLKIFNAAVYPPDDAMYMSRLLPIKCLESLTYQQRNPFVVNQNSVAMFRKIINKETKAAVGMPVFLNKDDEQAYIQLIATEEFFFDESLKVAWKNFIKLLAREPGALIKLVDFIGKLGQVEILPMWLHLIFAQNYERLTTSSHAKDFVVRCINDYANDQNFLEIIDEKIKVIKAVDINAFADERRCQKSWDDFFKNIVMFFSGHSAYSGQIFFNLVKDSQIYGRIAAVQAMRYFVDTFDKCIKAVKGSSNIILEKKISLFNAMLKKYFDVLYMWVGPFFEVLSVNEALSGLFQKDGHLNTKKAYLELLTTIISKEVFSDADLKPTQGVNIAVFAMGAGHDFITDKHENVFPKTGEDAFSIIHQSLLNVCGVLSSLNGGAQVVRPPLLAAVEAIFNPLGSSAAGGVHDQATLIGVEVSSGFMRLHYNKVLNSHSCQISLNYWAKKGLVDVTLHFCGGTVEEVSRWYNEALLGLFVNECQIDHLEVALEKLDYHEVMLICKIKHDAGTETLDAIRELWRQMLFIATNKVNVLVAAANNLSQFFRKNPWLDDAFVQQKISKKLAQYGEVGPRAVQSYYRFVLDECLDSSLSLIDFDIILSGILKKHSKIFNKITQQPLDINLSHLLLIKCAANRELFAHEELALVIFDICKELINNPASVNVVFACIKSYCFYAIDQVLTGKLFIRDVASKIVLNLTLLYQILSDKSDLADAEFSSLFQLIDDNFSSSSTIRPHINKLRAFVVEEN